MIWPTQPRNVIQPVPGARISRADGTPRQGDRIRRQLAPRVATAGGVYPVCGTYSERSGTCQPCDYPYWHMMLWGTEPVYRLIRSHPTVSLARYIVLGPVLASPWDYTFADGMSESDAPVRWVKDVILPMRRRVMREAVRALDYGYQPFSVVWSIVDGMYTPELKPLLPDTTTVLEDRWGNFAGIENRGDSGEKVRLNNLESWVPSLDGEAGYKYGRSRYENIRTTAWANWLETLVRMNKLQEKLSGIIPIVQHSPDGYVDDDGEAVNFSTEATTMLESLSQAAGVRVETALNIHEALRDHGDSPHIDKIINAKAIDVDFYDAGNVSQALPGFIQKLEYLDKMLFRGMLRPERAGLEAVAAGSRADSEQHTETGAADSEAIDADLTESFDRDVVYTALRLNFGEDAARRVHLVSSPLIKWKQQVFWKVLDRMLNSPEMVVSTAKALDVDAMLSQMSIPTLRKFAFEQAEQKPEPTSPQKVEQQVSAIRMALASMA